MILLTFLFFPTPFLPHFAPTPKNNLFFFFFFFSALGGRLPVRGGHYTPKTRAASDWLIPPSVIV